MQKNSAPLLAALVVAVAAPALASHSWNNYHWARQANPVPLRVVDSVTSQWQFAFEESLSRWGQSTKIDNTVVAVAEDSKLRKRCPMVLGQIRICNAAYGQNGWLGMATINIDAQGHITQGTTKVNDSYGWYYSANPGEDNHVMCQEIGHNYGLGHTSEDGSSQGTCMDYSSSLASQWPNAHDYAQLDTIYAHLDSYNTYDSGSGGGGGGGSGCSAPPGKGCNKHGVQNGGVPPGATRVHYTPGRDGHLGHADWVLPDGKGGLWLYHATLVPEDAEE